MLHAQTDLIYGLVGKKKKGRGGRWLRDYATNQQVPGLIPDDVIGIFQ